jgi:hypothetical protein
MVSAAEGSEAGIKTSGHTPLPSGPTGWGITWRLGLLAAVVGVWLMPESWLDSSWHYGEKFVIVFLVANLGLWVAPGAAIVDVIRLVPEWRHRGADHWRMFRAVWAGAILCHLLILVYGDF